jgi:hypothetical protein
MNKSNGYSLLNPYQKQNISNKEKKRVLFSKLLSLSLAKQIFLTEPKGSNAS